MLTRRFFVGASALAATLPARPARAQAAPGAGTAGAEAAGAVTIGAVFPLSGPNAAIGERARHAIALAFAIANEPHPGLDLPLAAGRGLPGLGGGTLRAVFADHGSDPAKGRQEAERLIETSRVSAIIGSYQSAVGAAVSQVCESAGIPYLAADNSAPSLTRRGLRFIFRPAAHDEMFSLAMFDFLDGMRGRGRRVGRLALVYEDTLFGTDSSNVQRRLAAERGYEIAADLRYRANAASLAAEARELKAAGADVVLPTSYTRDGILLVKAMAEAGYRPRNLLAQDAGFSDPALYGALGPLAVGCLTRASFSPDLAATRPAVAQVNALFRERAGSDLGDLSSRQFTAASVLAEAVDRAGSAEGGRIRDALAATSWPGDRTIMPWRGVRFDEAGQNPEADPVLLQWTGDAFATVFPDAAAAAELRWPMNPS